MVSLYINPVIIETKALNDLLKSSAQGLALLPNSVSWQRQRRDDMTYAVDSQQLLDIEKNFNWMKAGLDLVDNRSMIPMFWWKPM